MRTENTGDSCTQPMRIRMRANHNIMAPSEQKGFIEEKFTVKIATYSSPSPEKQREEENRPQI